MPTATILFCTSCFLFTQ
jgi:hypothetical protein